MALRIVLVDDDENLAELLRLSFQRDERFEFAGWARNGPLEGLTLVGEHQPRLQPHFARQSFVCGTRSLSRMSRWPWIRTAGPIEEMPSVHLLEEPDAEVTNTSATRATASGRA